MSDDLFKTGGGASILDELGSRDEQLIGRQLGDYEITALVGEGGMGQVYRARRIGGDFDREVAIKLVASRLNDALRQRFLVERQILAELNHPGIAQLYDAGLSEEGWPYLVMEFVPGVRIDEYCREQELGTDERIELIIKVAEAVSHAHARLIVHRDLKPSNVLVADNGRPKLLDFGIAKLIDSGGNETTMYRPMTPNFASPEQLLGKPITIASDVYQMGLLAYAVMTGSETLIQDQTIGDAIERAGRQEDLRLPRKARESLPVEITWIIERCLRADADDRYRDVNELRDDLVRYQQSYPPRAAPPSASYRLRKLLARNRPATLIATAAIVAIVTATTWYTMSLRESRAIAESRAQTTSRVLRAMTRMVGDTYAGSIRTRAPGQEPADNAPDLFLRNILTETESVIERELASESGARTELMRVQGNIRLVLGELDAAEQTLKDALDVAVDTGNSAGEFGVLLDMVSLAVARTDIETAQGHLGRAESIASGLDLDAPQRAALFHATAEVHGLAGEFDAAIDTYKQSAAVIETLEPRDPVQLSTAYFAIAANYNAKREPEAALEWANKAIDLLEAEFEPGHFRLIGPYRSAGMALQELGEFEQSRVFHQKSLESARSHYGEIHPQVADALNSLGALAYRETRYRDAISRFQESLLIAQSIYGEQHVNVAGQYSNLGVLQMDTGDIPGAEISIGRSMAIIDTLGDGGNYPRSIVLRNVARLQILQGQLDAALETINETVALRTELFGLDNARTQDARMTLYQLLIDLGRVDEARSVYDAIVDEVIAATGPDDEAVAKWRILEWEFDEAEGRLDEARTGLEAQIADQLEVFGGSRYILVAASYVQLADICLRLDDPACAEEALQNARAGLEESADHPVDYQHKLVEAEWLIETGRIAEGRALAREALGLIRSRYPARADLIDKGRALLAGS